MGLFGKKKDERTELKSKIEKLMSDYDKEKIDGPTYFQKMMNLNADYNSKKKKK
ncbi:hypothetical protein [Butyrivibrio sp. AE2005]|uniref:hypothetical protein n=1 Tax=Butyrivibrio sp. AE2005 TaxID=1496722 RepID=UPI000A43EAA7|nr:hypothetical protein [Butyrivibrio sp. AE2005]